MSLHAGIIASSLNRFACAVNSFEFAELSTNVGESTFYWPRVVRLNLGSLQRQRDFASTP